jgi:hypothetical protein
MKIKKLFRLILVLWVLSSNAQMNCDLTPLTISKSTGLLNSIPYIPNSKTEIKTIRVNIQFMLKSNGSLNFTETNDGNGNNNYTGYNFAEDLIYYANQRLSSNQQLNLPIINPCPIIEKKYRYILNGVFFNRDDAYFAAPSQPQSIYDKNIGETINVYLQYANGGTEGGNAFMSGNRSVRIIGTWEKYIKGNFYIDGTTALINHEIAHCFSVLHTIKTGGGTCDLNNEDYCSDTPVGSDIYNTYGFSPCCGWNSGSTLYNGLKLCSNNMMDDLINNGMSPEQLGRVHWTLENELKKHQTCHFELPSLDICGSFGYPQKVYIASKIISPNPLCSNNWASIPNKSKAVFIIENSLDLNSGFEVQLGAEFEVIINKSCN